MAKLGRPIKTERPENYYKICDDVYEGRISEREAASMLGMSKQWFRVLLKKDFPNRPKFDRRPGSMQKIGQSNRKFSTWLELNFTDKDLCDAISGAEMCKQCPLYDKCNATTTSEGIIAAMLKKYPLKPAQNTLEEK